MRAIKGYRLIALAVVACPCHWPLLALLLSGTAVGAFVADNAVWLVLGAAAVALGTLAAGRAVTSQRTAVSDCAPCAPPETKDLAGPTAVHEHRDLVEMGR